MYGCIKIGKLDQVSVKMSVFGITKKKDERLLWSDGLEFGAEIEGVRH
jgi:hypothetical protein